MKPTLIAAVALLALAGTAAAHPFDGTRVVLLSGPYLIVEVGEIHCHDTRGCAASRPLAHAELWAEDNGEEGLQTERQCEDGSWQCGDRKIADTRRI